MALLEEQNARAGGGGDGRAVEGFMPSATFVGMRRGHVFKRGPFGVGYYRDELAALSQPLELAPQAGVSGAANGDGEAPAGAAAAGAEARADDDGADAGGAGPGPQDGDEPAIQQRAIPDAVFGSAAGAKRNADDDDAPLGALERFKQQRRQ